MKIKLIGFVLISIGIFFLLQNLGIIKTQLLDLIKIWWPSILIIIGIRLFFKKNKITKN